MDWSKVTKEHVDKAIKKFIEDRSEHLEPDSYYLMYNGEKLPSRYIRGLAYSIATGEEINLEGFSDGDDTVKFFKAYGYTVEQMIERTGKAWLLTWNPDKLNWEDYKEQCVKTKHGEKFKIAWRCSNKQPVFGDDVFLMKLGNKDPKGIIAHGYVVKTSYPRKHYDPEKAVQGKEMNYIDVEYDRIQNFEADKILLQAVLKDKFPEEDWSAQKSGIEIKEKYFPQLKKMWNELIGVEESDKKMNLIDKNMTFDKNMILYGPPGTGKTYNTAIYAVAICDGEKASNLKTYKEIMDRYYELMKEHRISFVTFHQSYGYEEFIEGIKPVMEENTDQATDDDKGKDVKYDVIDGVFKKFCDRARASTVKSTTQSGLISDSASVWKATIRKEVCQDCFANNRVRIDWDFESDGAAGFVDDIQKGDIIITTNKSRSKINGIAVVTKDKAEDLHEGNDSTSREVIWLATDIDENIKALNKNKMLHRRTVARVPNMIVADIVSLAKRLNPENDVLAQTTVEENKKAYVFVIDEINRGNISKIFGELITLIEDTKREGAKECISAILPYSGDEFTVPDNVYILGTMNTADRSIALMDTALRRRFNFKEMMPDTSVLKDENGKDIEVDGIKIAEMLETINKRIEVLYDREHTIGHAYFMPLRKLPTIEKLAQIFSNSIIPLLQEYFYEDYEKIRLVLGDNQKNNQDDQFVISSPNNYKALFGYDLDSDVTNTYKINKDKNKDVFKNAEAYKSIYEPKGKENEMSNNSNN